MAWWNSQSSSMLLADLFVVEVCSDVGANLLEVDGGDLGGGQGGGSWLEYPSHGDSVWNRVFTLQVDGQTERAGQQFGAQPGDVAAIHLLVSMTPSTVRARTASRRDASNGALEPTRDQVGRDHFGDLGPQRKRSTPATAWFAAPMRADP